MQTIVIPLDHHQVALLPKLLLTFQRKTATAKARLESLQVMKIVFPSNFVGPDGAIVELSSDSPEAENSPMGPQAGDLHQHPALEPIRVGVPHPHQTQVWLLPGEILFTQLRLRQVGQFPLNT